MADLITAAQVLQTGTPFAKIFAALPAAEQAALVTDASADVEEVCRRTFAQQTYDETYDGSGTARIWLRQKPVVAVSAVYINGDALDNTFLSAWSFDRDTGELARGDGQDDERFAPWFPRGRRNIRVVYAAGYLTVPRTVQRAVIFTVQYLWQRGVRNGLYKSESIGKYSYELVEPLPGQLLPGYMMQLLNNYVQDDGPL
jgi:hypothetical protein